MRYYDNEAQARAEIATVLKPIYGSAHIFIGERNPINLGLREVLFVARVPRDDAKCEAIISSIFNIKITGTERIEWNGSKVDFLNDNETEYILIKTVVTNG